jgi:hypothetical protein
MIQNFRYNIKSESNFYKYYELGSADDRNQKKKLNQSINEKKKILDD